MTDGVNMMRHLLWKDAMTIKPMLVAIVVAVVGLNLAFLLFFAWMGGTDNEVFIGLWILMPNLVALGAPALLVGSEEESGTLGWLRTLPMRWQQIADSKFIVSLSSVVATWIVASAVLAVVLAVGSFRNTAFSDDVLRLSGVTQLAFFSLLLLACGFATAYLFRSPVTGLITLIPLVGFANMSAIEIGRWVLSGQWWFEGVIHNASIVRWFAVVALAIFTLAMLWLVQRILARRRLTAPQGNSLKIDLLRTNEAYRPPARAGFDAPSQLVALLWQQARQLGWAGVTLTVLIAASVVLYHFAESSTSQFANNFRTLSAFAPMVITLGASWLGVLAFYGDSAGRRCVFFADRGVSPTSIWLTRLFLPGMLCFALVLLQLRLAATASTPDIRETGAVMAGVIVMMFLYGQLVAQWMPRATLTFLAAPAYAMVSCIPFGILFGFYPGYYPTILLMSPVLLFTTWRMMGRWLCGVDKGFHYRIVAYTLLAVLVPCLAVFGHRYGSTPAAMTQWRAEMFASIVPPANDVVPHEVSPDARDDAWRSMGAGNYASRIMAEHEVAPFNELMKKELASDGAIAAFTSRVQIEAALRSPASDDELRRDAIAIYLKWATAIREDAVVGVQFFSNLESIAESAEERAVELLEQMIDSSDAEWAKLVDMIPSDKLRRQSRSSALIREWHNYQRMSWRHETRRGHVRYYRRFADQNLAVKLAGLSLERRRADRYVDLATQVTLQQLADGLPANDSADYRHRQQLWIETLGPWQVKYLGSWDFGETWTRDYQQRIDRLRAHVVKSQSVDRPVTQQTGE